MIDRRIFKEILSKGITIELYVDEDDVNSFIVGRIVSLSDSNCTIECINNTGLHGGFEVVQLSAIRKIQWGTRYIEQILLLSKTERWWEQKQSIRVESSSERNLVLEELRQAKAEGAFVSLGLVSEESESSGIVEAIEGNNVVIKEINVDGECDGFTLVPLERIVWLKRGGFLGNKYLTFYENRSEIYKEHQMSLVLKPGQKRRQGQKKG